MPSSHFELERRQLLQWSSAAAAGLFLGGPRRALAAPTQVDKDLIVHERVPHNAEPALADLVQSWITPLKHFYVRSHAPVPEIDPDNFAVTVEGLVDRPFTVTLAELQRDYKKTSVVATLTCAGNRRVEHSAIKPVSGVPWQAGAIGNAQWGGVPLAAILRKAGLRSAARHVWFESVDRIERSSGVIPFGASVPLDKAMAEVDGMPGALVAYEMNEQPLTPDHGFPMRTVVPGYIGARSVKWLGKIVVSDVPSPNHYVATAYKLVQEGTSDEWANASPIGNYRLNSVICIPPAEAEVRTGRVVASGYALPTGLAGNTVDRVEVSVNAGRSWLPAHFTSPAKPFCWRLWTAEVPVTPSTEAIWVRATDSQRNTQPAEPAWNLKGYLFNSWHKVPLNVQ